MSSEIVIKFLVAAVLAGTPFLFVLCSYECLGNL